MDSAIFTKLTICFELSNTKFHPNRKKNITKFFSCSMELRCDMWSINMESTDSNFLTLLHIRITVTELILYLIIIYRLLSWKGEHKQQIYFQNDYSDCAKTGKPSILRDAEYRHLSSQHPWQIPPTPSKLNLMKFRPTVRSPIISYRRTAVVPT